MQGDKLVGNDRPAKQDSVISYYLADEIVLFAEHSGLLYHLNNTAAIIWCCCEEQQTIDEIIQTLVKTFAANEDQARRDVCNLLAEWTGRGLLVSKDTKLESRTDTLSCAESNSTPSDPQYTGLAVDFQIVSEQCYWLIDCCFRLRCDSSSVASEVRRGLHHLMLESCVDVHTEIVLSLSESGKGFTLYDGDSVLATCEDRKGLLPLVHAEMLLLAYCQSDSLFALHSAAIVNGANCVLLPGAPGSGKSTLTAALISTGWMYYTDEISLLERGTGEVRPVPACIGLKSGSWNAVEPYYPAILELPEWRRTDGQYIRYLPPPSQSLSDDIINDRAKVTHIIFPVYQPKHRLVQRRVDSAEALCRIADAGYDAKCGLNRANVDQLVDWIQGITCIEMQFCDLAEAIQAMNSLNAVTV